MPELWLLLTLAALLRRTPVNLGENSVSSSVVTDKCPVLWLVIVASVGTDALVGVSVAALVGTESNGVLLPLVLAEGPDPNDDFLTVLVFLLSTPFAATTTTKTG